MINLRGVSICTWEFSTKLNRLHSNNDDGNNTYTISVGTGCAGLSTTWGDGNFHTRTLSHFKSR